MSVIYLIVNLIDNKVYVGSTKDAKQRKFQHFSALKNNKHHSHLLQRAWNKGNPEDFEFKIIEILEENQSLQEREQFYIDLYISYDKNLGYNIKKYAYEYTAPKNKKHKIYQFTLEGEFIQSFNSSREAGVKSNCDFSCITKCCNKHRLYCKDYIWSYNPEITEEEVILANKYIAQKAKERSEQTIRKNKKGRKPVLQYDLDGNFIKEWSSASEASLFYTNSPSQLHSCLIGKHKHSKGFIWKFK